MGVIYKLTPEVREFILETKRANPAASCRGITQSVFDKYQINVSKSSVNSLIKEVGLSMPVGRRAKPGRRTLPGEEAGTLLFKAADILLGGTQYFVEAINAKLRADPTRLQAQTDCLLFRESFLSSGEISGPKPGSWLWSIAEARSSKEEVAAYVGALSQVKELPFELSQILSKLCKAVRCIKITLASDPGFYIDGQFHTVWSSANIPLAFSTTISNAKSYINRYFKGNSPLVLFMSPGYDKPTKEFFNFLLAWDSPQKSYALTLYNEQLQESGEVKIEREKRDYFIFGLWPWQFVGCRKLKRIGEFKSHNFTGLKFPFYLAEAELELSQPDTDRAITLRGYALKHQTNENPHLFILTNAIDYTAEPEELVEIYLNRWPNLEEGLKDFSAKIERSVKTAESVSVDSLAYPPAGAKDVTMFFSDYIKVLETVIKTHFLPFGLPFGSDQFFGLRSQIKRGKNSNTVSFKPPPGYPHLKALEYACRRINEREIILPNGKRLWLFSQ